MQVMICLRAFVARVHYAINLGNDIRSAVLQPTGLANPATGSRQIVHCKVACCKILRVCGRSVLVLHTKSDRILSAPLPASASAPSAQSVCQVVRTASTFP